MSADLNHRHFKLNGPPICHVCGSRHWNACPALWGGNPERPEGKWACSVCKRPVQITGPWTQTCPEHPQAAVAA